MRKNVKSGFTLLETVIAASIMSMIVVAAVGAWLLFLYKSNRVHEQAILDMDAHKVVELFRHEVRNAARETIMFYPEHQQPYEAIGFALAKDTDNDGLMDMDASGSNILWRQTVIYHVWKRDNETPQMRRTIFDNRNNEATYADYYQQMASVVSSGSGSAARLAGERSKTEVLFENLFSGKLWHAEAHYDGYAPEANTRETITFGSLPLGPGAHQVDLTITGKHPDASGRRLRIDQMSIGVSGWPMEAEALTYSGAAAQSAFAGPNQAGAAYGLTVATAADGDKISMLLYNDVIEEFEFIGSGRNVSLTNTVVRFDDNFFPSGRPQGAFAAMLDGQYTACWQGGAQTADGARSVYFYPTNCLVRIPIMAPWVNEEGFGPVFRLYKSLYNGDTTILNPHFAIVPTPIDGSAPGPFFPADENIPLEFYQRGSKMNNWDACAKMDYVELRPAQTVRIEQQSTLMLTFEVRIQRYLQDRLTAFRMLRPDLPGCWIMLPQTNAVSATGNIIVDPDGLSTTNSFQVLTSSQLPLLEAMAVSYADGGEYISHVYDTRTETSVEKTMIWDAEIPSGSDLKLYARSGNTLSNNGFDISDASAWNAVSTMSNGGTVPGNGRYVQFRAVATAQSSSQFPGLSGVASEGPYRSDTPRLHRVQFAWDGESKYVDVTGSLLKSPDCGMFKIEVDGKPLIKGVTMEIEIYKDINTLGKSKERLRSTMVAEVEPRNSQRD